MSVRSLSKNSFTLLLRLLSSPLYGTVKLKHRFFPDSKLPILVYHKITDLQEGIDAFWSVSGDLFAEHMAYLRRNNYTVLPLSSLIQHWLSGSRPPPKAVVITFDDGYASVHRSAFPILRRYRFPATVFLTAGHVENGQLYWWDEETVSRKPEAYDQVRLLTLSEIEELKSSGLIEFGSHSMTHPHLGCLGSHELEYELRESKKILEERLRMPITLFAYPGGSRVYNDFNDQTKRLLQQTGYQLACTSLMGRNERDRSLYLLKRIGMSREDVLPVFRAKLTGAMDWVGLAQSAFQLAFKNVW